MKLCIARLAVSVSLIFVATVASADGWIVKVPLTSYHWGDIGGYDFNENNLGFGVGRTRELDRDWSTTLSLAVFPDSYGCLATNVQLRGAKEVFSGVHLGASLNVAFNKCIESDSDPRTIFAPTGSVMFDVTNELSLVFDFAPAIADINRVGFVGFSAEWKF